jgi:hypothetical protein
MTGNVFLHIESHACEYHLHELFMNDARSRRRLTTTTSWHAPQKEPSAHWDSSSIVRDMSEKAQKFEIYYTKRSAIVLKRAQYRIPSCYWAAVVEDELLPTFNVEPTVTCMYGHNGWSSQRVAKEDTTSR